MAGKWYTLPHTIINGRKMLHSIEILPFALIYLALQAFLAHLWCPLEQYFQKSNSYFCSFQCIMMCFCHSLWKEHNQQRVLTGLTSRLGSPFSPFSPCRETIKHCISSLHTVLFIIYLCLCVLKLKLGNADLWPRCSRVPLTAVTLILFFRCLSVCGALRWDGKTETRSWPTKMVYTGH